MAKVSIVISLSKYKRMKKQIKELTRRVQYLSDNNAGQAHDRDELLKWTEIAESRVIEMQTELYPLKEELFLLKRGEKAEPM